MVAYISPIVLSSIPVVSLSADTIKQLAVAVSEELQCNYSLLDIPVLYCLVITHL